MTEIETIVTVIISSFGLSVGGAWWLSKSLVSHKLSKDLEDYKSQWKKELDEENIKLTGSIKEKLIITLESNQLGVSMNQRLKNDCIKLLVHYDFSFF